MLSASISCCEASSLSLKALVFCRSQKGVAQLQQDLLEPSSQDTHRNTHMMMLKLLSDLLQQSLLCLLLSLYCFHPIYSFWKQGVNRGAGHRKKDIINNSNQPSWWITELPIISHCTVLQCKSHLCKMCLSVIMCETPPSFSAVDSAWSLSCFSSFTAINTPFNTFWAFSTLTFLH